VIVSAAGELEAPPADVWALVAEPYHLPDWWPGYRGVTPDRRGLAPQARWTVQRSDRPGLLRRPGGEALIVIARVEPGRELAWHDVRQGFEAGVRLEPTGQGATRATAWVAGPGWRLVAEGARGLPRQAVGRLRSLCHTAATL
jgi:uncharacterized protein YndB with AHSA1/START domain